MRLYHHSEVVRRLVPELMQFYPHRDRAAIPLSDTLPSPHIIVTQKGRFVTCLSAAMTIDVPVLPYASFQTAMDRADAERESARCRHEQLRALSLPELHAALNRGPGHVVREMVEIVERQPETYVRGVGPALVDTLPYLVQAAEIRQRWESRRDFRRRARKTGPERRLRTSSHKLHLLSESTLLLCLPLLGLMDTAVVTEMLFDLLGAASPYAEHFAYALSRHRDGGERLYARLADRDVPRFSRWAAVHALAAHLVRYPQNRRSLVQRLLLFGRSEQGKPNPVLGPTFRDGTAAQVEALLDRYPHGMAPFSERPRSPIWQFTGDDLNWHAFALAPVSALYPPRALAEEVQAAWRERLKEPPPEPEDEVQKPQVRSVPRVGRNAPCPCKSGAKYKHCCMDRPAPAPGAQDSPVPGAAP